VTPYAETWICARELDGILEGIAVGHDGRARQYSFLESAHYAKVYSASESEIICVDNQLSHEQAI
jgi:hypothetical protein